MQMWRGLWYYLNMSATDGGFGPPKEHCIMIRNCTNMDGSHPLLEKLILSNKFFSNTIYYNMN